MQMILLSSCSENLVQFAYRKFHIGVCKIIAMHALPDTGHNGPVLAARKVDPVRVQVFVEGGHYMT